MMKTRLLLEETIINCSFGSRFLMVKTILQNLASIKLLLKPSDGARNKEVY